MKTEDLSFEFLLHGEFEDLLNPAETRRKVARRVPQVVAERLVGPVEREQREAWCTRFIRKLWPALQFERGTRWDLGWAELTAGFAVAIELLAEVLPAAVQAGIEGTPAQALWERERRPYARYTLLLDGGVRICRVFVGRGRRLPDEPVEKVIPWRHDGPDFRGRSHTLLLALMVDGLLPETVGPLAATGELVADGRTVGPVLGLVDKVEAWRRDFPGGMLVTGPLGQLKSEDWEALAGGKDYSRSTNTSATERWFTGGSIAELSAKLNEPMTRIQRWDGSLLDAEGLVEVRLRRVSDEAPEHLLGDALLDAAWAASQQGKAEGGRRGILIEGEPGAGKSILSRVLEQRFRSGLLGALGFGVRRSARKLAEDLPKESSRSWPALLAIQDPGRRELFEELERTGRLVPIIDGLDELSGVQLREVAALLRASPGWWVATSRPVESIRRALLPAWRLKVEEPSREEARKLLVGAGRADLAERLYGEDIALEYPQLPGRLSALTRTPLHLTLLARVLHEGEDPEQLADHTLYQRVFEGLLDQACMEQRLTERGAEQLRVLQTNAIGALALEWLQAPGGYLDRATIDQHLEEAGFKVSELSDLVRALEFGHLLARAGDDWDFAHRTMAEWAASEALHREVMRRQREHARVSGRADDRVQRARIELEVLAPFLDSGSWAQFLRFYAPHLREPLALLERLTIRGACLGWPRMGNPWDPENSLEDEPENELEDEPEDSELEPVPGQRPSALIVLGTWGFIFELIAQAEWRREDARVAWGIAVRRWILFEHSAARYGRTGRELPELKSFARAVASHLPRSLPELCALAARTEGQKARLLAEPTLLLPAIPPTHASTLDSLLRGSSRKVQLEVLEWYAAHGLPVDDRVIDGLIETLSEEVVKAQAADSAERSRQSHEGMGGWLPRGADSHLLERLEALVWETSLRTRQELPWQRVRARLRLWPRHLEQVILRWFGLPSEQQGSRTAEVEHEHRRDVLAACLDEVSTRTEGFVGELRRLKAEPEGAGDVGFVWNCFDDSEERHLQHQFEELAEEAGWSQEALREARDSASSENGPALRGEFHSLRFLRKRLEALLQALHETRTEEVLGRLWDLLPPGQPEREVVLKAVVRVGRPPSCIPVSLLLNHYRGWEWGLERMAWTPVHLKELRALSTTGQGELRFTAIRLLAQRENRDETVALLQAVPSADEKLLELIRHHLERGARWMERAPTQLLSPEVLAQLPLEQRAEREVPGWRSELLVRLASVSDPVGSLVEIAEKKGVREVLPLLAERLEKSEWKDRQLIEAIARLCTQADTQWARVALRHALLHGWPDGRAERYRTRPDPDAREPAGEVLADFLTLDDLDLLARGAQSALPHPSLSNAIRRLGPEARERLTVLYQEAANEVAELERQTRPRQKKGLLLSGEEDRLLTSARERRAALAETLVASLDPARSRLRDLVDLAFHVAGGDVHRVYGVLGPLGSDFDEPGDLDWHSDQENGALVEALDKLLEGFVSREPESWQELRRLFGHPSETLRLRAFELCADLASPHQVAELALEALEGHVRANRTRWTGNTTGYLLSGGPGAGSSYVSRPQTLQQLADAIRMRLTPAHRQVIERLARHELPMFRALAARWAGQLGSNSWSELIRPLLGDRDAGVVGSAIDALLLLAPEQLGEALRLADRSSWSSVHDTHVLQRLRAPEPRHPLWGTDGPEPVNPLKHVTAATVELLLAESGTRCVPSQEDPPYVPTPFDGFPSLVERLCDELWKGASPGPESVVMLRQWSLHRDVRVRSVARRLRAARRLMTPEEVLPLLSGEPSEQVSSAECLVRMADEPHLEEASAVWRAALGSWEHRGRLGRLPLHLGDRSDRLLWALQGATLAFAPLLGLVAHHIDYDHSESSDTPEGERVVMRTLEVVRRWGEPGMAALLDLIEAGQVEDHYSFMQAVKDMARRGTSFRALLRQRADGTKGPAYRVYSELREDEERVDLDELATRLAAEVLPEQWPMLTYSTPPT